MCEVASFKNFENSLTTVKVMTKNKVAPFYLGHGVFNLFLTLSNLHSVQIHITFISDSDSDWGVRSTVPKGLDRSMGPSAIPRKFPANTGY